MHQTIRALGWIITIIWIIILILPVTVAFSLIKIFEAKGVGIQEPRGSVSNGTLFLSIPFYIDNTGFYDLTDVEVKLQIFMKNETLSTSSAKLPNVPAGDIVDSSCNFSISLEDLLSKNRELLTSDTELNVNASLSFRVASAIAFQTSTGTTIPWGAPFHKLTIYNIAYDNVSRTFSASISFENNAFFQVNGSLSAKLYNSAGELIGSAKQNVNAPPHEYFEDSLEMTINDPSKITHEGVLRLYFADMQVLEKAWELQ
ncbi:MAG: hypothetical protein ACPLRY_03415 [Candidatus Bathyarchaeales archaeon]